MLILWWHGTTCRNVQHWPVCFLICSTTLLCECPLHQLRRGSHHPRGLWTSDPAWEGVLGVLPQEGLIAFPATRTLMVETLIQNSNCCMVSICSPEFPIKIPNTVLNYPTTRSLRSEGMAWKILLPRSFNWPTHSISCCNSSIANAAFSVTATAWHENAFSGDMFQHSFKPWWWLFKTILLVSPVDFNLSPLTIFENSLILNECSWGSLPPPGAGPSSPSEFALICHL